MMHDDGTPKCTVCSECHVEIADKAIEKYKNMQRDILALLDDFKSGKVPTIHSL